MKQQILIIHGGNSFANREDYLSWLRNAHLELEDLLPGGDWKSALHHELGSNAEILLPKMPCKQNANYEEWSIWFSKMLPLLNDGVILIGHSLGGIFLAKYLAQNNIDKKIKATILVAAPFDDEGTGELASFNLPASLEKFSKQAGQMYLFHSEDDVVVPVRELECYLRLLPKAVAHRLTGRGHFNSNKFPELVSLLKTLSL